MSGGILGDATLRQFTACILVSGGILGDATIDSVYSGEWWYFGRCDNLQRVFW